MENENILEVKNLKIHFEINDGFFKKKELKAVNDVSFEVKKNEIFCIVGESGCGKTTIGRAILKIYKPTAGKIYFNGLDIQKLDKKQLENFRSKCQMIFQDSFSSLDPHLTIEKIISEPLEIHKKFKNKKERKEYILKLMKTVDLSEELLKKYPTELSGGQAQRVNIARSLALEPDLIVCDEATSALDVSVQAQIINMFLKLIKEREISYIFITHNLLLVKFIADRIAVMYLGKIVELASKTELFKNPLHPYTKLLFNSILTTEVKEKKELNKNKSINDDFPSPFNIPSGCPFRTRCPMKRKECEENVPSLKKVSENHYVSCLLYDEKK